MPKNYGVGIVIGEETNKVSEHLYATLELDLIAVKGKDEAVRIFTMMGGPEEAQKPEYKALRAETEAMLATYKAMKFEESWEHMEKCREMRPDMDVLWDLYQERLEEYRENPPPADWDGVFRATSKYAIVRRRPVRRKVR